MRVLFGAALLAFGLDQLSKWFVVHHLNLREVFAIDVLPPLLNFRMGWNTGINFGLFSGSPETTRWLLVGVALAICAGIIWWVRRDAQPPRVYIAAGLLVGGALGNVLDRVIYGAVADFLNMSCCGINNPFTFNVADIFVFAGAIGLALFTDQKKQA